MELKKYYVPYEQALQLRKLGFAGECFALYDPILNQFVLNNNSDHDFVSAPIYAQAFDFFKSKYNMHAYVQNLHAENYRFIITDATSGESVDDGHWDNANNCFVKYATSQEAELEVLKELINIVERKENEQPK